MSESKVSVVIPIYNAEKYLRQCLDSVINQTLKDMEIICVDDGSTDNSLTILREFAAKDERIRVIARQNAGAAAARNVGMASAEGEYLAFLDADDLFCADALQRAYAQAVASEVDVLLCEAEYFTDEQGRLRTECIETQWFGGLPAFSANLIPRYIFQVASCNTWNKLYRREFVQRVGLKYQEIRTANDLCFVYSALACAEKIAVLKQPLVRHRVLKSGNLQSVKVKTPLDFLAALLQLKSNLRRWDLWGGLKQSYINAALFHCLYNWQTLDKRGRRQIVAKRQDIIELLELEQHSGSYFYNKNDYDLMCRVVRFQREGELTIMGKIKDWLKHILPPPVNAFNREVAGIKQMMLELNAGLEAQQRAQLEELKLTNEQYKEQLTLLENKIENKNQVQLALLEQQQSKLADIERQQQKVRERLADIQTEMQSVKEEIVQKQDGKIVELQSSLKKEAENIDKLQSGLKKDVENIAEQQKNMARQFNDELPKQRAALFDDVKAELNKPVERDYAYYEDLFTNKYEKELKLWYKSKTGEELNLQNPKTFNEKIQWLKLYDSTPLKTRLADKYLVREWVAEKIGEEYLIPLLGVWDSFDEIDFAKLPERFVLKANHGYNWNYIVKDKAAFDKAEAKANFDEWLGTNFAFKGLELQYMNIPPKIIAEEYLENGDNDLYDYKVFCFGGKAESIMYLSERKQGLKMAFFDLAWQKLPFTYSYPRNEAEIPRPKNLPLLIELAEKLAEGFPHVRVDFYILNDGSLKFGEMTFTTANGTCKWNPSEQNRIYGDLIKLPPKSTVPERM